MLASLWKIKTKLVLIYGGNDMPDIVCQCLGFVLFHHWYNVFLFSFWFVSSYVCALMQSFMSEADGAG